MILVYGSLLFRGGARRVGAHVGKMNSPFVAEVESMTTVSIWFEGSRRCQSSERATWEIRT